LQSDSAVLAAGTVFALVPLPLVFADAAAAATFTLVPLSLVLAEGATAAVFAHAPHPLVLADVGAAADFALAPTAAGVRRGCGCRSLCTWFSAAGARKVCVALLYSWISDGLSSYQLPL